VGGLILDEAKAGGRELLGFAVIFALAVIFRTFSSSLLYLHPEIPGVAHQRRRLTLKEFLSRFRDGSVVGKYVLYLAVAHGSAYVAAPFFTPFMLKELQLSYAEYVTLIAASFAGKAASYPTLGKLANKFGVQKLLLFSGIAVMPLAGFWIVSDNFLFLLVLQIFAGVAWAGFELATVLYVFNIIKVEERTSVLSYVNVLQSTMMTVGSLIGGAILLSFEKSYVGYMIIFLLSSALRTLTIVPLFKASQIKPRFYVAAFRTLGLRPSLGSIDKPIMTEQVLTKKKDE